jgi:hypothetical protein
VCAFSFLALGLKLTFHSSGSPSYLWNIGALASSSGCGYPSDSSCTLNTANTAPGEYSISVAVKDSAPSPYLSAPAQSNVTVNSAPAASITPSSASITAGNTETFSISVTGGTGPFLVSLLDAKGNVMGTAFTQQGAPASISFTVPNTVASQAYRASVTDSGTSQAYSFYSQNSTISVLGPVPQTPASSASAFASRKAVAYSIAGLFASVAAILIAFAYYISRIRREERPR